MNTIINIPWSLKFRAKRPGYFSDGQRQANAKILYNTKIMSALVNMRIQNLQLS